MTIAYSTDTYFPNQGDEPAFCEDRSCLNAQIAALEVDSDDYGHQLAK
ncbi:MAG: hypothetical protein GY737_06825 [Desulfobacteraceae bacterium]|nr:hypothetical protein [Desulfobacteraceae bacterium]